VVPAIKLLCHARRPHRLLGGGHRSAAVVRLGLGTHLRGQLELFSFGSFVERLAERFTVIRSDKPGCGPPDREGVDLSFDARVATAVPVADAVRADWFSLFGASQGGQLSAAISARYPHRVEALVLYGMCASGAASAIPRGVMSLGPVRGRITLVDVVEVRMRVPTIGRKASPVLTGLYPRTCWR
jgi:pimeloyl-ACP methyl ester carboxylesterase